MSVDYRQHRLPETNRFRSDENPLESHTLSVERSDGTTLTSPVMSEVDHDVRQVRFSTKATVDVGSLGPHRVEEHQWVEDLTDVHVYSGRACLPGGFAW